MPQFPLISASESELASPSEAVELDDCDLTLDSSSMIPPGQQRLIRRVITPALRWWLQTQIQSAQDLTIELQSRDQQLLRGYLPLVQVLAVGVIYQGLVVTQAQLQAENIRINLGQLLRGKPLKLLEPVQALGTLHLSHQDLQQSLGSQLMRGALRDLLVIFKQELKTPLPLNLDEFAIKEAAIEFGQAEVSCQLHLQNQDAIHFRTELGLANPHCLEFRQLRGLGPGAATVQIDLGEAVYLEDLTITPEALRCTGGLTIFP